jgi:hypothetical protein
MDRSVQLDFLHAPRLNVANLGIPCMRFNRSLLSMILAVLILPGCAGTKFQVTGQTPEQDIGSALHDAPEMFDSKK